MSRPSLPSLLRRDPTYTPVIGFALSVFQTLGLKLTEVGKENVPETGGGVVIMNHQGYLDFALAGVPYWHASRRLVRFMAKDQVFKHKVSGPLMRGMHHIPVDRSAGADAYKAAVEALKAGELIGVFPEATISPSWELEGFKSGAARMALEAGVPLIPTAVMGSNRVWTKGRDKNFKLRQGTPIVLVVGRPVHLAPGTDAEEGSKVARAALDEVLQQALDLYPDAGEGQWWWPASRGGTAPPPPARS